VYAYCHCSVLGGSTVRRRALLAAFGDDAHAALLLRLLHELSDSGLISQVCSPGGSLPVSMFPYQGHDM